MAGMARKQFTDPIIKKLLARIGELPDIDWRQSGSHLIVSGSEGKVCVSIGLSRRKGRTIKNTKMRLKRIGVDLE